MARVQSTPRRATAPAAVALTHLAVVLAAGLVIVLTSCAAPAPEPRIVVDGEEYGQRIWARSLTFSQALNDPTIAEGDYLGVAHLRRIVAALDGVIAEGTTDADRLRTDAVEWDLDERSLEMLWLLTAAIEAQVQLAALLRSDYRLALEELTTGVVHPDTAWLTDTEWAAAEQAYNEAALALNNEIRARAASPDGLRRP